MFPVYFPWQAVAPTLLSMSVVPILVGYAIFQEAQTVQNFAVSVIKTFKGQIPPTCWEKQDDIQVLNCFLREGEGSTLISREKSPAFIRDFKEYQEQNRDARGVLTVAGLIVGFSTVQILTGLSVYCYCRLRWKASALSTKVLQ